jgi:hypothetical protein
VSNTYRVVSAGYNGTHPTSPNPLNNDPLVYIALVRNGVSTAYGCVYWSCIQNIFAVAGVAGLQSYFAAIADAYADPYSPFNPPTFPTNTGSIPAPVTGSINDSVVCAQALVGTWTQ